MMSLPSIVGVSVLIVVVSVMLFIVSVVVRWSWVWMLLLLLLVCRNVGWHLVGRICSGWSIEMRVGREWWWVVRNVLCEIWIRRKGIGEVGGIVGWGYWFQLPNYSVYGCCGGKWW
jgi:hypothetical protein